jgi:transposase
VKKDIKIIRSEFHRSPEARYVHRLHGVLLVLLGLSTVKAGKLLGVPQRTVSHWMIQFRSQGINGLWEAEKSGRPEKLNPIQKKALGDALQQSPHKSGIDAEVWTGPIISSFLRKRYGLKLTVRTCARLLRAHKDRLGL